MSMVSAGVDRALRFVTEAWPGAGWLALPGAVGLAFAYLMLAGWLKQRRGWPTGYTRKVFHFLVFTTVALLQATAGLPAVCVFGTAVSLVVFHAVWRGDGFAGYEAMAREKDAPRRTYFILAPYGATLLGGVTANLLFGPAALGGYLVAGIGDAIAEPVGTRWGRHRYRVPSRRGVTSWRSWEGSAAVFCASLLALVIALLLQGVPVLLHLAVLAGWAALCALAEAVSPHGWDNATLQLLPSALLYFGQLL